VVGDIVAHIGTYQNVNPRSLNETRLSLYLMDVRCVLDDWAEGAVRQRRWVCHVTSRHDTSTSLAQWSRC
jgi:hypothetical protein